MSILILSANGGGGGVGGILTADNGLNLNTPTNVELGGELIKNTTVNIVPSAVLNLEDSASLTTFLQLVSGGTSRATLGNTRTGPITTKIDMQGAGVQITDGAGFGLIGEFDFSAAAAANNLAYIQKVFADANYAGTGNVVLLTTNQTVDGNKTFNGQTEFTDDITTDALIIATGTRANANRGLLFIDPGGVVRQYNNVTSNDFALAVGAGLIPASSAAAVAIFGGSVPLGVLMPAISQADRLALSISGTGSDTGLIVYQTDGVPGFYELMGATSSDWRRMLTTDDLPGGDSPVIEAPNKVTGVTASGTLTSLTVPGSTSLMYRLNVAAVIRSITGSVTVNYAYTDDAGNAQTGSFFNPGSVTAAITTLTNGNFPPINIFALNGTTITISQVITGTVIADFASMIEFLI